MKIKNFYKATMIIMVAMVMTVNATNAASNNDVLLT